ncbi:hypothetical protein RSOL_320730, partial [Rhizoctonia solani AG-3 Rhs1AP]
MSATAAQPKALVLRRQVPPRGTLPGGNPNEVLAGMINEVERLADNMLDTVGGPVGPIINIRPTNTLEVLSKGSESLVSQYGHDAMKDHFAQMDMRLTRLSVAVAPVTNFALVRKSLGGKRNSIYLSLKSKFPNAARALFTLAV